MLQRDEIENGTVKRRNGRLTDAQRAAAIKEMDQLLSDPTFRQSKRCVSLLRSLIERALAGNFEGFKERTLGAEVFNRNIDYDTNADPIVRMTANEIRKRLAQYYQEPNRHYKAKIRLIPGSYLPEFDFDSTSELKEAEQTQAPVEDNRQVDTHETLPEPELLPISETAKIGMGRNLVQILLGRKWRFLHVALSLAVAAGLAAIGSHVFRSTLYLLWEPLLASNQPLTLCISDDPSLTGVIDEGKAKTINNIVTFRKPPAAASPPTYDPTNQLDDAIAANRITNWLAAHGGHTLLNGSNKITMRDIGRGPLVLIGSLDNPWSLILLSDLRYRVRIDPTTLDEWIEDAQNPSKREWKINAGLHFGDFLVDYAIITRFWDRDTGNWVMAVNGLGPHGGSAAVQLLTVDSLAKSLPAGIRSKMNFQIVLKSAVLNGNSGPPQVLTVYTW